MAPILRDLKNQTRRVYHAALSADTLYLTGPFDIRFLTLAALTLGYIYYHTDFSANLFIAFFTVIVLGVMLLFSSSTIYKDQQLQWLSLGVGLV